MRHSPYLIHGVILGSIFLGLVFAVFPLPVKAGALRPEFICLLCIFWVTNMPQYVGIFYAWCIGLMQDIVEGTVWGAHAMALAIVAYICIMAYQRIKNYSIWHQALWIFVLVGFHQVIVNWIQSMAGYHNDTVSLLVSTAISAVFWPLVFVLISKLLSLYRIPLHH